MPHIRVFIFLIVLSKSCLDFCALIFLIDFKFVGDVAFPLLFLRNFRIGNRFEIAEINFGKENIARIILIDLRQVDPVTEVRLHGVLVHRRSADDPDDVVDVWISGQSFDRVLKYIIDKNLIIKLLVILAPRVSEDHVTKT